MEGQVASPHPKGLEAANLEVLESVGLEAAVAASLDGPEVASWRARRWRPGGPGCGGSSSKEMRRRCGGPGGRPGGGPGGDGPGGGGRLGDPAVEVRRRLVFRPTSSSSMEGKLFLQVNLINEKIKERSHELVVSPFGD
ncbi:unnamed protein product [Boreogadus saida]